MELEHLLPWVETWVLVLKLGSLWAMEDLSTAQLEFLAALEPVGIQMQMFWLVGR